MSNCIIVNQCRFETFVQNHQEKKTQRDANGNKGTQVVCIITNDMILDIGKRKDSTKKQLNKRKIGNVSRYKITT